MVLIAAMPCNVVIACVTNAVNYAERVVVATVEPAFLSPEWFQSMDRHERILTLAATFVLFCLLFIFCFMAIKILFYGTIYVWRMIIPERPRKRYYGKFVVD